MVLATSERSSDISKCLDEITGLMDIALVHCLHHLLQSNSQQIVVSHNDTLMVKVDKQMDVGQN